VSGIPARTGNFCRRFQLELPILLAPMSGHGACDLLDAAALIVPGG
jgi:hypothetical protein